MKRMSCTDTAASPSETGPTPHRDLGAAGTPENPVTLSSPPVTTPEVSSSRSLIVDERFFEEQFLRCQICQERFDQSERAPKSLPCNHTFCQPCLTQVFDHAQPPAPRRTLGTLMWAGDNLEGILKCPTCRVEIFLSRSKINDLPNDHRVVQMMDFLLQAVAKSQNVCAKHDGQPLNFFCNKCFVPVCRDCTVLDHKDSEGHTIVNLSEAISENSSSFNQVEVKCQDTLEKMKSRSDCLANASKRLDILERRLKSEIKETFIEYRLLLEKRQEALTSMVNVFIKDQKAKVNSKFAYVCENGTHLQKLYDEFEVSRKNNDIRKLFALNQQFQELENQFEQIAVQDDSDLFQSCEFEALNEGSFLSDLSGLGEVRTRADPELRKAVSAHQLVQLDMEEARERERVMESRQFGHFDDLTSSGESLVWSQIFGHDDHETAAEEDEPQSSWPTEGAIWRHLLASQLRAEVSEPMEDQDSAGFGSRRSRRGRRSRDTNSYQVQSSMAVDSSEPSRSVRFAEMRSPIIIPSITDNRRSGSRNRTPESSSQGYRVVRHPSATSMRNQAAFNSEDSN